jgi:hypothetical protein
VPLTNAASRPDLRRDFGACRTDARPVYLKNPSNHAMSSFSNPYERCAAPGCKLPPVTWSRYCPTHSSRWQKSGHPLAYALRGVDLRRHRSDIAATLASLETAPAVIAAHAEAARVLDFRAPHGAPKAQLQWAQQMQRLRDKRTKPREVVQRVCEVLFIDQDAHFLDVRSCEFALARNVLKLRSMHGWQPGSPVLAFGGELLHEAFAVFALKLRKFVEDRRNETRERREAMRDGWPTTTREGTP